MASRVYSQAQQLAEVTKTGTTFTDVGSCALTHTPNDNTAVLYIWSVLATNNSTTSDVDVRLYADTDATEAGALNYEPQESSSPPDYVSLGGIYIKEYGSSPGSKTLSIEYGGESGTKGAKEARLVALELGSNDKYSLGTTSEDSNSSTSTPADVTSSSVTFTPPSTGNYLLIWSVELNSAVNGNWEAKLVVDGADTGYVKLVRGPDTTNWLSLGGAIVQSLDATSHTLKIQFRPRNTGSCSARRGRVVALRLSDFAATYSDESSALSTSSSTYVTLHSYAPNIATQCDHLIFGYHWHEHDGNTISGYSQFTDGGSVVREMVVEAENTNSGFLNFCPYIVTDLPTGSGTTYSIQAKTESSTTYIHESGIYVLQLEVTGETVTVTKVAMTMSGQNVATNARTTLQVTKAAMTMTGQAVVGNAREILSVANAAITLTGQAVVANARTVASIAAGALTLTGQAVTATAAEAVEIAKATLTLTGQAVVGNARTVTSVAAGAMTLTGQALVANARTVASIAAGALTLTGQAVVGNARTVLAVAAGAMTLTGQAVTTTISSVVTVTKATLALTGQAIVTNARENLAIAAGSIALTGQNVLGNARHSIEIAAGALTLTGQAIVTNARTRLEIAAGSITLSGQAFVTNAREALAVAAGSITLTGQAVVGNASEIVSIAAGSMSYAGQAVTARLDEVVQVSARAIILTGQALATITGPIPPAIRRILAYPVSLTAQIWAPIRADTGRPSTTS